MLHSLIVYFPTHIFISTSIRTMLHFPAIYVCAFLYFMSKLSTNWPLANILSIFNSKWQKNIFRYVFLSFLLSFHVLTILWLQGHTRRVEPCTLNQLFEVQHVMLFILGNTTHTTCSIWMRSLWITLHQDRWLYAYSIHNVNNYKLILETAHCYIISIS